MLRAESLRKITDEVVAIIQPKVRPGAAANGGGLSRLKSAWHLAG